MSTVKSGYMRKHSKSIISGGWNQVWVVLHDNGNLVVYKKQGDSSPMGTINLFDVRKWFAYGDYANDMPERPNLPPGATIKQLLAVPQKPSSKAKIHWFLADTETDLHAWMEAICKVLPPPPQETAVDHHQQTGTHMPSTPQPPLSSAPPPYPGGPGPALGFGAVAAGMPMPSPVHSTSYPQQTPYPQQPQYPQQAQYPQQQQPHFQPPPAGYPQQNIGYPQQNIGYPQQNMGYPQQAFGPPHGVPAAYPQQQYYQPQGGYYQQAPGAVVYQQSPHKKGFLSGGKKNAALGILGGAALGYGASRMMGGGLGGGMFGWGRRGSWSSLDSWGSGGSFGSFGSFD